MKKKEAINRSRNAVMLQLLIYDFNGFEPLKGDF